MDGADTVTRIEMIKPVMNSLSFPSSIFNAQVAIKTATFEYIIINFVI